MIKEKELNYFEIKSPDGKFEVSVREDELVEWVFNNQYCTGYNITKRTKRVDTSK